MTTLLGGSPLFRKIMASILLASVFFLTLLTIVVVYSNEILEDDLLAKQTEYELKNTEELLAKDPQAALPSSASLSIYLESRRQRQPIPAYLDGLADGVHHDIKVDGKSYHVMIAQSSGDRIFIVSDITEIERSEELLTSILLIAWVVLLVIIFFIARLLSRRLSGPIAKLVQALVGINPDQRGVRLADRFEDDEVGRIAQAFDAYTQKMDDYVEKQIAFAAMASHELRSPLTIVNTSADLIACRRADDADTQAHLQKIRRATAHMTNMIHALLAVTRDRPTGNAGEQIALKPLIDDIIDSMRADIGLKNIAVDNRVADDAVIEADGTLVSAVLSNLVKNSIKHGENGNIRFDFDAGLLVITDDGSGLDEHALEHLFDFGYRGQKSEGYGIGLYISKLVCDHQGWGLELTAAAGGGVSARLRFTA